MIDKKDIERRYSLLDRQIAKRRQEAFTSVSKIIREETQPLVEVIQKECETTGHHWIFDGFNWDMSYQWDKCKWCGKREGADKHNKIEN